MDRRPFDGLKVEDEDLDGLGQKSCDGLEAIELDVSRPWEFDTWSGDKTTASKSSDGLEAAPMDWRPVAAWSSNRVHGANVCEGGFGNFSSKPPPKLPSLGELGYNLPR